MGIAALQPSYVLTFAVNFRDRGVHRHAAATGRPPTEVRTVLQQYLHWFEVSGDDVVLMQVGAFVEPLQRSPRRLVTNRAGRSAWGLRTVRPTRRCAIEGFTLPQLPRRAAAILASGRSVTLVGQPDAPDGRIVQRIDHKSTALAP